MDDEADVERLIRGFESLTLPRSDWTHRAHLTMALWYLRRHPRDEATRRIRRGILAYNGKYGKPGAYHETVTLAWVAVVARFLQGSDPARPVAALAAELAERCGDPGYLGRHYSPEVLGSGAARLGWVPPDREPIEGGA